MNFFIQKLKIVYYIVDNHLRSSGLEDALDEQVSKSNLLSAGIAQSIESLRRNRLGPGSNPAQPRNPR